MLFPQASWHYPLWTVDMRKSELHPGQFRTSPLYGSYYSMKTQLETDFISRYVFQPVYSLEGKLLAVELLSRFNSSCGNQQMPPDIMFNLLSKNQKIELLAEQISVVETCADWFFHHGVKLTINLEAEMVTEILINTVFRQRLKKLSFIEFEISERFPRLSLGKNNSSLRLLSRDFRLWLDHFGSGHATMVALYDGLFSHVKVDRHFFWQLSGQASADIVLSSLIKNISPLCSGIVVTGIEKELYLQPLSAHPIWGVQGHLWPEVGIRELDSLLARQCPRRYPGALRHG